MPLPDRRTLLILAGSTAITALLVALMLWLGGWAYKARSGTLHAGRLARMLEHRPTVDHVREGVLAEPGNRLIATPESDDDLRRLVSSWSPAQAEEAIRKRRRLPRLLVFGAQDVVYLVYFDAEGKMADFLLLTGPRP